jgi:ClpP class serine protease
LRLPGLIVCELVSANALLRIEQLVLESPSAVNDALMCYGGTDEIIAYVSKICAEGWHGALVFVINESVTVTLPQAWDWQELCVRVKAGGVTLSGFVRDLNLATILALSPAEIRRSLPLAGPIHFSAEILHIDISPLLSLLNIEIQEVRDPPGKPVGLSISAEPMPAETLASEQRHLEKISKTALDAISQHTGHAVSLGMTVATGSELAEIGILTSVGYEPVLSRDTGQHFVYSKPRQPRRGMTRGLNALRANRILKGNRELCVAVHIGSNSVPGGSNLDSALTRLAAIEREGRYRGVLTIVDLDGGDLSNADEFAVRLGHIGQRVPVVAYLRTAVSAGYLLACSSTEIVVNPLARIGGFGAVSYRLKTLGPIELLRIVGSTEGDKGASSSGASTARVEESLSRRSTIGAKLYAARVKRYRNLSPAGVSALSNGRLLGADEAHTLGFGDRVGRLLEALKRLSDLSSTADIVFTDAPGNYSGDAPAIHETMNLFFRNISFDIWKRLM